ncbi:MAG: hypothetical protein JST28_14695 [Acidobacteria bacterium]|nr:hypothetical protein [Acidobacteriota bacterium]
MSPITNPNLDYFLLGFIAACSLVAGLFFLRFYRATRDPLFLAFLIFFVVQGCTNAVVLELPQPNIGTPMIFFIRLLSVMVVLIAILWKNLAKD